MGCLQYCMKKLNVSNIDLEIFLYMQGISLKSFCIANYKKANKDIYVCKQRVSALKCHAQLNKMIQLSSLLFPVRYFFKICTVRHQNGHLNLKKALSKAMV